MNTGNASSSNLKKFIKGIPVLGPTASKLARLPVFQLARSRAFPGSASFWESRYREGGNSGSGSYGRLAEFKAEILNDFVRKRKIRSIIEFGCGDGAQLELATYPGYVGVDVSKVSIERCSARFAQDPTKHFYLADALPQALGTFELALSLDVIFHLVEDSVFDFYMRSLFARSEKYVIIYSSNYDAFAEAPHVRHRKFDAWIGENAREWQAAGFVPNRFPFDRDRPDETSFADFYFFARPARGESHIAGATTLNRCE
jgi:SAM-dependent methyltransferase